MNIYFDMVGCRLNQAEIEQMARQFRSNGFTIAGSALQADAMVINTCAVTSEAASDSRQKIRQAARQGVKRIFVTGCWSELSTALALELPNVVEVIKNDQKDILVNHVLQYFKDVERNTPSGVDIDEIQVKKELSTRTPIPGQRQKTRAFIKIQDGCNNSCTFCITTIARGTARSTPISQVISDIQFAITGGAQEIVLTGVHLGSWGQDIQLKLTDLIKTILSETNIPRLRLSSIEPWDLDDEFFSLWNDTRLCPHLHMPLQSGCNQTLKRMLRKTTAESYENLVESARKTIPGVAITTDIIVGFPGETEEEFLTSLSFIKRINFAGAHIFSYSQRPGTPASRIKEQIPLAVKKQRNKIVKDTIIISELEYQNNFIRKTLPVLWEASAYPLDQGWQIEGLTPNYLKVKAFSPDKRWNTIDMVQINQINSEGIFGEII